MHYQTISGTATAHTEEKHSKFIASIAFVDTDDAAIAFINKIKKEHSMATHNVYAYVLREGERARYSDDGEPAKTAGMPVLEVIRHAQIVDCAIVVTRYFGGTLLGTGGLVRAYTNAAKSALAASQIVTISLCVNISLQLEYALYEQAQRIIQKSNAKNINADFAHNVSISFTVINGEEPPLIQALTELARGILQYEISPPFYTPF